MISQGLSRQEFESLKEKIRVGGYVNYTPTSSTVETDPTKTGYATKQTLTTDTSAKWRILSINDNTGEVMITTQGPVNSVTLNGITAYLYSSTELHRLCQGLYSNSTLGLTAKSMTIEDLDKATGYVPLEFAGAYAWYPADVNDNNMADVVINGRTYTARKHTESLANGFKKPRFYAWDDNAGQFHTSANENGYNDTMSTNNPTLTSRRWYDYNPGANNSIINDIIGGDENNRSWLASTSESYYSGYECADFDIRFVHSGRTGASLMCLSNGESNIKTFGMKPVIYFNINRIDVTDSTKNGSLSAAWEIK